MQREETVVPDRDRGILRWTEPHVIAIEIAAGGIRGGERPEVRVVARGITRVCGVILRDRLHRPLDDVPRLVLHGCMKVDPRGLPVQTNGAPYLNTSLGIDGAGQFNLALPSFRKFSKGVRTVIDHIGIAYPVLFIVVSFRQQPDLVAAVVEPPV